MRYRVRKPRFAPVRIATAPLFTLHILVMPFVAFRSLYTNLPNAEAIHLFRILGWILNHLFGAGRFAMRASTLALALIRIHLFRKIAVSFFCIEKTALSDGFLIFVVVLITLRNRRF